MKNITITFPQVKINFNIDEINFDTLEETAFNTSRQIGLKAIEKALFDIDNTLRDQRPKRTLENTGRKQKYFLTRLGDIRYKRRRYIDRATGKPRYLLEEKLGIQKNQRISLSRARIELLIVSMSPYRQTQKNVELLTGCRRSHEAIRQSVIKEAKRILAYEEHSIDKIKRFEDEATEESAPAEIAYIEADEAHIRFQRRRKRKGLLRRRKRRRRTIAVKLGIGYSGKENRYSKGSGLAKSLHDKFAYISLASGSKFMENLSLIAEKKLLLSRVKNIFFGGDGDMWITKGIKDFFPGTKYLLCLFHLYRNIKRALCRRKEEQRIIKRLIIGDKIDKALKLIQDLIKKPKDIKEKEALRELYHYISKNRHGINAIKHIKDKGIKSRVRRTGAIEPNIDKIIAHRFKKRGMSWSRTGALSLLKIRETIVNNEWENWWLNKRDEKIEIDPEPLKQLSAKDFWTRNRPSGPPLIEAAIPALAGPDHNQPWAKVIRELQKIDYYKNS